MVWFSDGPSDGTGYLPITLTNNSYKVFYSLEGTSRAYGEYFFPIISNKAVGSFDIYRKNTGSQSGSLTAYKFFIISIN